jgi:hypothetical protein
VRLEKNFGPRSTAEKTLIEVGRIPSAHTKASVGRCIYARSEIFDHLRIGDQPTYTTKFAAQCDGVVTVEILGAYTSFQDGSCNVTVDVIAKRPET